MTYPGIICHMGCVLKPKSNTTNFRQSFVQPPGQYLVLWIRVGIQTSQGVSASAFQGLFKPSMCWKSLTPFMRHSRQCACTSISASAHAVLFLILHSSHRKFCPLCGRLRPPHPQPFVHVFPLSRIFCPLPFILNLMTPYSSFRTWLQGQVLPQYFLSCLLYAVYLLRHNLQRGKCSDTVYCPISFVGRISRDRALCHPRKFPYTPFQSTPPLQSSNCSAVHHHG